MTKEKYNDWCRQSTTQGHFISAWEGINPAGRVVSNNPARKLYGIIADYDNPGALSKVQSLGSSTNHLPTWVVESFSPGKCRLIWPFEDPILVTNASITEAFLKELDGKIKISKALPGFDASSWKESQYFELGTNWQQIAGATPIPNSLLSECMLNGGLSAKMDIEDTEIPLDVIAEEVERRWPGLWGGPFEEGTVGPLFWVQPFVNHRSAVIRPNGMVCFSTRAVSNFMPWRAILGNTFIDKYETERAAKLGEMFYFDGARYWTDYSNPGKWRSYAAGDVERHLKEAKCNPRPAKGQFNSEVDKVILHIQNNRYVNAAVPMLFHHDRIVPYNGSEYLNISNKKVMLPAEDGDPKLWPWIHNYLFTGFDGEQDGIPAIEFLLGWWQRLYKTSLEGNPQQGQSIIVAGEAHTGKSFLSRCLIGFSMGGSCTAEDLLLQRTKFNKEAAYNAIWRCDDAIAKGDNHTKLTIAHSLKAMASNPVVNFQPKFMDSTELPFKGRVILTCNVDPESLKILPYLDGSIKDKLMLFRIAARFQPHFFDNNRESEGRALAELPHFLRWLLDYKVNPAIIDIHNPRFLIRSFHHKTLVQEANSEQPESIMAELIHRAMVSVQATVKKGESKKMTATELAQEIEGVDLGNTLRQLGGIVHMGKLLHKVIEQRLSPHLTEPPKRSTGGATRYAFDPWADLDEAA